MSAEHKCGNWIEHFPSNAKWSNAIQIVKGMAPWGAVSPEEVDWVAARMTVRAGESDLDTVWSVEAGMGGHGRHHRRGGRQGCR